MKIRIKLLSLACTMVFGYACSPTAGAPVATRNVNATSSAPVETFLSPTPLIQSNFHGQVNQKCISFTQESLPISGEIAALDSGLTPSLINVKTGVQTSLGGEVFFTIASAADHDRAAYIDLITQRLMVINAEGKVIKMIPVPQSWRQVLQWKGNDTLLIENFRTTKEGPITLSSTIAYNLSSGKIQEYLPDYPNLVSAPLYYNALHWQQYSTTFAVYSPDLDMVIYPAQSSDETPIILWSVWNKDEVVRIHAEVDWASAPQWNSDGSSFIIAAPPRFTTLDGKTFSNTSDNLPYFGGHELFSVSKTGQVKRLTYLTRISKADERAYVWSPDNKLVAFWLKKSDRQTEWELNILDTVNQSVTDLCLLEPDYPTPPVWSVDDNYLVVNLTDQSENKSDIVLIDLAEGSARKIADQAKAKGWLVTHP